MSNVLYCGDNLDVMAAYVPAGSIDLAYLDPPFNSKRTYRIVCKDSGILKEAFKDSWSWDEAAASYAELVMQQRAPLRVQAILKTVHEVLLGEDSDLLAYLTMMAPRLVSLHDALNATGSLYLHCDPTASHYLKLLLDAVFGSANFRAEIVWKRSTAHSDTKQGRAIHGHIHDSILFYTKSDAWAWNAVHTPYSAGYTEAKYRFVEEGTGRRFRKGDLTAAKPGGDTTYEWHGKRPYRGRSWAYSKSKMEDFERQGRLVYTRTGMPEYKRYLDEMPGLPLQDVWTDIDAVNSRADERLGYPTQKPLALLERIVRSSSHPGDLVLDPFCGCGTTAEACERWGRRWIGIDIARSAVHAVRKRLVGRSFPEPSIVWYPAEARRRPVAGVSRSRAS
jgi:DNA modification methylase